MHAYGWDDLAARMAGDPDAMPRHLTEDSEDDHKYQGRYFWPAPIRDDVLARLLTLNATRAEEERKAGKTAAVDEGESCARSFASGSGRVARSALGPGTCA